MQLSDLKLNLENFLKGDLSAETETMLSCLGYVKKSKVAPPAPAKVEALVSVKSEIDGKQAARLQSFKQDCALINDAVSRRNQAKGV